MKRLDQYDWEANNAEWVALYEDEAGRLWREKMTVENASPTGRSKKDGAI
jgi:hypothetical protein